MNKSRVFLILGLIFVFQLVLFSLYHFFVSPKIAYVKTGEITTKYKGIINANKQLLKEVTIIQANIDTLKNRYQSTKKLAESSNNQKLWYEAGVAEKEFQNYSEKAQQEIRQRESELSGAIISKINTYIQEYGKSKGYSMILGTTNDGSILYGKDGLDLTSSILKNLNDEFVADSLSKK